MPTPIYRMPIGFGPMPGPRQAPDGGRYELKSAPSRRTYTASFQSSAEELARLLPPPFRLFGEPVVTIEYSQFRKLPWLAGRGYDTLGIKIPAKFKGEVDTVAGPYLSVLWENLADPIVSGREELGFAKLYCELTAVKDTEDIDRISAEWDSHPFFEMRFERIENLASDTLPPAKIDGTLHYKYIPRTGDWGTADAEYPTISPHPSGSSQIVKAWSCRASAVFTRSTFDQLPTLFHIVNTLADLTMESMVSATIVDTIGGTDISDQRILR